MERIALIFVWLFASATYAIDEITITLSADEWCPYNCSSNNPNKGYIVEIAETIYLDAGIEVNYVEMPWSRAILATERGEIDGIIGAGMEETPSFIFPKESAGIARHSIFSLPELKWQFDDLVSLERIQLGVIQDYSYGTLYDEYISRPLNDSRIEVVWGDKALPNLIQMLEANRIDAFAEDENVVAYTLASRFPELELTNRGVVATEKIFIAFSPVQPDSDKLARIYDAGIEQLRKDGRLTDILQKYQISDWKK